MSCLHEFSLRMHTYIGLQACFARKQTMLAGYEDSMQACPACMNYPYPGVRPSKAGLRPYLIPASGHVSADFVFIWSIFTKFKKRDIAPKI